MAAASIAGGGVGGVGPHRAAASSQPGAASASSPSAPCADDGDGYDEVPLEYLCPLTLEVGYLAAEMEATHDTVVFVSMRRQQSSCAGIVLRNLPVCSLFQSLWLPACAVLFLRTAGVAGMCISMARQQQKRRVRWHTMCVVCPTNPPQRRVTPGCVCLASIDGRSLLLLSPARNRS